MNKNSIAKHELYTNIILKSLSSVVSTLTTSVEYLSIPYNGVDTALEGIDVAITILTRTKSELEKSSSVPPKFEQVDGITGYHLGWWHCGKKAPPIDKYVLFWSAIFDSGIGLVCGDTDAMPQVSSVVFDSADSKTSYKFLIDNNFWWKEIDTPPDDARLIE